MTALGTGGCGFEMQLEALLKALWPADPDNLTQEQKDLGTTFLFGTPPHGDTKHREFLRGTVYHPTQADQLSVLSIILLTGEEDCSAGSRDNVDFPEHPNTAPDPFGEMCTCPLCYGIYNVNGTVYQYTTDWYVKALRALRPGDEPRTVFAAITGIPPMQSEASFQDSDAYFQAILDDPLMQERTWRGGWGQEPSYTLPNPGFDPNDPLSDEFATKAYPARRIVEVARGFGENGVIQSICQENFDDAVDGIILAIARQLV